MTNKIDEKLGVETSHVRIMQKYVDKLERANDYIADTPIRHAISQRLVEIRLLLRDGDLRNMRKS